MRPPGRPRSTGRGLADVTERPDIADAVARMSRTISVGRELRVLPTVLEPDETVDAILRGTDGTGFGLPVLTDRRLFFLREGLSSRRLHVMALSSVASVAWRNDRGSGDLVIVTVAERFVLQAVGRHDGGPFADAVRRGWVGTCRRRRSVPAPGSSATRLSRRCSPRGATGASSTTWSSIPRSPRPSTVSTTGAGSTVSSARPNGPGCWWASWSSWPWWAG